MSYLEFLLPYLVCFVSLLVGATLGLLFAFLARKGRIRQLVRDRLTVYSSLLVWLILSVLLWITSQNNPITNRINNGGWLS